jgi:heterogeneous nuclear ribonucleoprotein A1/A3
VPEAWCLCVHPRRFVTFDDDSSVDRVFAAGQMHDVAGKQVEVKSATPRGTGTAGAARGASGSRGGFAARPAFSPRAPGFAAGFGPAGQLAQAPAYGVGGYGSMGTYSPGVMSGYGAMGGYGAAPYGAYSGMMMQVRRLAEDGVPHMHSEAATRLTTETVP